MKPSHDIVFFDVGETLLHPHPSFSELFAAISSEWGAVVRPSDVIEVQERLAPHLVDLAEESGVENPSLSAEDSLTFWTYLYRRFLEELGIDDEELAARMFEIFSRSSTYKLFDDVVPVLATLDRAGYRLGIISNFERWLERMLVELEVGHLFDVSIISGIEGVEKPNREIYRIAIDRAGVDPARAAHVGDSVTMDVEPALDVGLHAILLDRVGRYTQVPYVRISTLSELPDALLRLPTDSAAES